MSNYLKITWSNTTDLGNVRYSTGYENRIFLDVEVDKPDYNVTIENELDGDSREIPVFRKWEKAYKFEVWGTEDLVDAFTFMQLHDTISVTLQTGETISVDQLRVDYDWGDCLCKMTVTFTGDYVIGTNCTTNLDAGCVCDDPGEFAGFLDIAIKDTTSGTSGDVVLFYDTEVDAGKVYDGSLWRLGTTGAYDWVEIDNVLGACYEDTTLAIGKWVWNGQYWILHPGLIGAITNVAGNTFRVTGIGLVPGAFAEIEYTGDAVGTGGVFLTSDFNGWGAEFDLPGAGNYNVTLHVYNHSCDYGNTLAEAVSY